MSLRSLSDQQILSRIHKLTQRERSLTLAVLLHLNEIERRKLHLKLGYSSLFDYCTARLGYSASAASRRIRTARCVARFPEVYELLRDNDVNVSTVAQVSRILTVENKDTVLARIRGKSQREVEAVVAEFEPLESAPKDRVRTVVVRVKAPAPVSAEPAAVMAQQTNGTAAARTSSDPAEVLGRMDISTNDHDRNGRNDTRAVRLACPADGEGCGFQRRTVVQFTANDEFMAKVELIKSLFWHQLPADASLEQVFGLAMDFFIERKDPARPRAPRASTRRQRSDTSANSRRIPAATKRAVYTRDEGKCTFVGPDGRRCASRRALQIDHVKPVSLGGLATANNLRLLCAYHNRFEAKRLLGPASRENAAPPGMC